MNKFKKGDRVVCVDETPRVHIGGTGTVVKADLPYLGEAKPFECYIPIVKWDNGRFVPVLWKNIKHIEQDDNEYYKGEPV